jgi:hypothetical protein
MVPDITKNVHRFARDETGRVVSALAPIKGGD